MDANLGLLLIPILGSILVVAFFSSSEAALISVTPDSRSRRRTNGWV